MASMKISHALALKSSTDNNGASENTLISIRRLRRVSLSNSLSVSMVLDLKRLPRLNYIIDAAPSKKRFPTLPRFSSSSLFAG